MKDHTHADKKKTDEITISKTMYRTLLIGVVVVLVVSSFAVGFTLGASESPSRSSPTTTQTPQNPSPQIPSAISVSKDDDPVIGDPHAKVLFIEFSDFQCPFCRRFYTQSLSQLEQEYIDTGKVLFVYRDFPLDSIHPGARPAAIAAECAEEQGKWREFHNKIFDEQNKQGQGTVEFDSADLKQWAADIGLDTTAFNSCLDSNKYDAEVTKDFQDGLSAGVSGTPTFFIGNDQDGYTQLVGAQPYNVIKQAIDQELAG